LQESRSSSAGEFFVASFCLCKQLVVLSKHGMHMRHERVNAATVWVRADESLGLKQRACDLFGDGSRLFLKQLPRRGRILSNGGAYGDDEQPVADPPYHLLTA
jgi:hypothetical protein